MGKKDPRVDAYIAGRADFARPLLRHLRQVVHGACPQVEETIKWGMPAFEYHGLLCMMAGFKHHAAFHFRNGRRVVDSDDATDSAMGQFGRLTSLEQLPPKRVLAGYVKKAMALNESKQSAKPAKRRMPTRPRLGVPPAFAAALARNKRAFATFEGLSPSHRREYLEWIAGAKRDETRARRIATALQWLAEGKRHNWRYEKARKAARG
jgi:uncharacterized protein YdeI (YjbR/CyaY-like superfamily)